MPISQKRELEIERELAVIVRELDRMEKPRAKKPEQAVQFPWAPPLLLDLEKQGRASHGILCGGFHSAEHHPNRHAGGMICICALFIQGCANGCCDHRRV